MTKQNPSGILLAMLPAATNPGPRLTPEDTLLLEAFRSNRRDLFALARHVNRPAHDLFAWFGQPQIQHALAILNQNEEHDHRSAARAHLRAVADAAENPTERRRAATSLLYSLARPARTSPARTSASLESSVHSPNSESEATEIGVAPPNELPPRSISALQNSACGSPKDAPNGTPELARSAQQAPAAPGENTRNSASTCASETSNLKSEILPPIPSLQLPNLADETQRILDEALDLALADELDEDDEDDLERRLDEQEDAAFAHLSTEEIIAAARETAAQLRAAHRDNLAATLEAIQSLPPELRSLLPAHPAGP